MLNSAEVVFLINVVFLLPSFLIGETSSELLRVAQGITIIYAIAFLPRIRTYHYVGRLCGLFALFTLLSVLSEFLHSTTDYLYIIRQVFHLLYFPCIFVVLSAVRKKMYFYGMFALLFLYVAELLIFLPKMNIDTSFLNGNLLENRLIKKAKYILLDEGYSLMSVHTIPLLFFSVIPFLSRAKRLLLSILLVFLLLFTFTFTVWAGVIAAYCIFLFASYKYDPLPRYFLSYVLLGGALLLSALCVFYPFETFTLTTGRSLLWEHAFTAFRSHWLFGISMDDFYNNTYQAFMQSGLQAVTDFEEGTFDFTSGGCHNIYLNVAMNKGLLAFLVYLAFLSTLWKAIRASDRGPIWMMGFFYMVVRCFAESTGIIETSSGKLELIFDIYVLYLLTNNPYPSDRHNSEV
ncbi:MAG: O-antigen ligase family protein [Bacteroidaceae bacterium]|nr:O-antigen ligase family protein [Bacteroidaceae bacterium]